jgi:hypothetical protein
MQLAFMQTAASCSATHPPLEEHQPCSDKASSSSNSPQMMHQLLSQQQQRYSLVPIAALPQLLAAAMPGWGGADVSYAALQIRCHMNIVANFSIDTPTAAAGHITPFSKCSSSAAAACSTAGKEHVAPLAAAAGDAPTDMMYAELAATIVSAAATEAAAASGELPAAVQQLVVDLADEVTSNAEAYAKLEGAWQQAAAAAAAKAAPADAPAAAAGLAMKLPVVAGVRLLCKQLVASLGLSDIRLLGWLTCLVRQQHLAMQLAELHGSTATCSEGNAQRADSGQLQQQQQQQGQTRIGVLVAEVDLPGLCEVLVQLVQCLLTADDAALVEDFKQQAHGGSSMAMYGQHCTWQPDTATAATESDRGWTLTSPAAAAAAAAGGAGTPEPAAPVRRQRIVFNGASSCSSSACSSPCWRAFAQQQHHSFSEDLRQQQQQAQQVYDDDYFQPVHCGAGSAAASLLGSPCHPDVAFAAAGVGSAAFANTFTNRAGNEQNHGMNNAFPSGSSSGGVGGASEGAAGGGGASLIPASLQQQREQQLQRLRAAQQQAWHAEMLLQHQPWEGAYSPLAAVGCNSSSSSSSSFFRVTADPAGADGTVAGAAAVAAAASKPRVADILRLSSSDYRSSCGSEC